MKFHTARWLSLIAPALILVGTAVADGEAPIRIACVGDSITLGRGVPPKDSYPSHLQKLLGDDYQIKNFGRGSATLIKPGKPNVWQDLDVIRDFQPNIVVILLGTNDTVGLPRGNWEKIDRFRDDYAELIAHMAGWRTKPRLVICTPTGSALKTPGLTPERLAMLSERKGRLERLSDWVRQVAKAHADKNVTLLELNGLLEDHPDWLRREDGVHPNAKGYQAIAKVLANHIRR